jgi:hypothetical protein
MNIKKLIATIITCVSLLGFAAIASANTAGAVAPAADINLYGSSAQFTFWKGTAATYLTDAGCTNVTTYTMPCDSNHAMVSATCNGTPIHFRITSKASWDGILSVSGNTTNPNLSSEATPQTESCSGTTAVPSSPAVYCTGYTRPMINAGSCSGTTCQATDCETVTGGASDVEATSIIQTSAGQLNGPKGGGAISRNFTGTGALSKNGSVIDTASQQPLTDCQEVVVPFAFWVSSDVNAMGVTNLNQTDIRMIFSGQIVDWSDLGFPSKAMNVCFRHAGSGTSATLQLAEMQPAVLYGLGEVVQQPNPDGTGTYSYYFNDGTSNEETCVNSLTGAVGYFDADKSVGAGTSYPNVSPVTYNGVTTNNGPALKAMIENGQYDFWTVENLFEKYGNTDMPNLCNFLKNAGNSGIAMPDAWYAYTCQLTYTKANDGSYMTYNGATCPQ